MGIYYFCQDEVKTIFIRVDFLHLLVVHMRTNEANFLAKYIGIISSIEICIGAVCLIVSNFLEILRKLLTLYHRASTENLRQVIKWSLL